MSDAWQSFGAQALHYFQREHEDVRDTPLGGAAAWRGADVRGRLDWIVELDAAAVAEIGAAVAAVRRRGLAMGQVHRADFPLPTVGPRIAGLGRHEDRQVVVVRLAEVALHAWVTPARLAFQFGRANNKSWFGSMHNAC